MNQSSKRTVTGSLTTPSGLPAIDDWHLAQMCSLIPLPPEDHDRACRLTVGLAPGKFGLLKRKDRDWLMKLAAKHSLLPRMPKKPKQPEGDLPPDAYSTRLTKGAQLAAAHLDTFRYPGGKMPVPPKGARGI